MTDTDQTINFLMAVAVLLAVGIGTLSMLLGKLVAWYDLAREWFMSNRTPAAGFTSGAEVVHVPGPRTGSTPRTTPPEPAPVAEDGGDEKADTNAPNAGTVSRHMSDSETIVLLAVQRRPDGRYRFSANAIYELVGGSRAGVLDQVRAVRVGAPEQAATFRQDDGSVAPPSYPISRAGVAR